MNKLCNTCGKIHTKIDDNITKNQGIMAGEFGAMKMFNCTCGSTLCIKIPVGVELAVVDALLNYEAPTNDWHSRMEALCTGR